MKKISRRGLFSFLGMASAAAVVPVSSEIPESPVGPMMFEHTCDAGKIHLTPEDIAHWEKVYFESTGQQRPWGCGTTFRWYFGTPPICPNCGWHHMFTLEDVKKGTYRRVQ